MYISISIPFDLILLLTSYILLLVRLLDFMFVIFFIVKKHYFEEMKRRRNKKQASWMKKKTKCSKGSNWNSLCHFSTNLFFDLLSVQFQLCCSFECYWMFWNELMNFLGIDQFGMAGSE